MIFYTYGPQNILVYLPVGAFGGAPAVYKALRGHWINTEYVNPGDILTEGAGIIPFAWVPTEAVDPLNDSAVSKFWTAGPRDVTSAVAYDLDPYSLGAIQMKPVTYWIQVPRIVRQFTSTYRTYGPQNILGGVTPVPQGPVQWVLTGLGASLPPRGP